MATAVFRVEKNKNFTVISNYHLQDKNLSLKAKGLLTLILSLPADFLDLCVGIMVDACTSTKSVLRIKGQAVPRETVRSRLLKLDDGSLDYVYDSIKNSDKPIKNIQSYLLTSLYCASFGSDLYYEQLVKADIKTARA